MWFRPTVWDNSCVDAIDSDRSTDTYEMSGEINLPPEILEYIFMQLEDETDLFNLSLTCKQFYGIFSSNELWKVKFKNRWPNYFCDASLDVGKQDWQTLYKDKIITKFYVRKKLELLAHQNHSGIAEKLGASDESELFNFLNDEEYFPDYSFDLKYKLITTEMMDVINDGKPFENLTLKYHADKSLWYLRHLTLSSDIKKYVSLPDEDKDLETGVVMIAQWFQPVLEFSVTDIKAQLETLADHVRQKLLERYPSHSLFTKKLTIPEKYQVSLWEPGECKKIMDTIGSEFSPIFNNDLKEYFVKENSFINVVLQQKNGIPISLCVIVQAVAKRLGVILECINFPRHFILRWIEHPFREGIRKYTFVDPFNKNYSLSYDEVVEIFSGGGFFVSEHFCTSCSDQHVLERILRNLVNIGKQSQSSSTMNFFRYTVELFTMFSPQDAEMSIILVQLYLHLKVNLNIIPAILQEVRALPPIVGLDYLTSFKQETAIVLQRLRYEDPKQKPVKLRKDNPEVEFSTGMVMKHRRYDYICVIYGWDRKCEASRDWITRMGVDNLPGGPDQPFYNVLVTDGSERYAAQESLELAENPEMVTHPEVGQYFQSFTGSLFKANKWLLQLYPDDSEVTERLSTR